MFWWPQNRRSRSTESWNLSGEDFFLLSTAAKTWQSMRFQVSFIDHGLKAASWTKKQNKNGTVHYCFRVKFNFSNDWPYFLLTTLIFLSQHCNISLCSEEIVWYLAFKLFFTWAFCVYFQLFSQMLAVIVQKWKLSCIWYQFVLRSQ